MATNSLAQKFTVVSSQVKAASTGVMVGGTVLRIVSRGMGQPIYARVLFC
jgi:hypothetical protein